MWEIWIQNTLAAIVGAITAGIPLYIKLRNLNFEIKKKNQRLDSSIKIDHEAEWKRIIEFRDQEMARLRQRDDQQEEKIGTLYNMNLECKQSEARLTERLSNVEAINKSLTEKLERLEAFFRQKGMDHGFSL